MGKGTAPNGLFKIFLTPFHHYRANDIFLYLSLALTVTLSLSVQPRPLGESREAASGDRVIDNLHAPQFAILSTRNSTIYRSSHWKVESKKRTAPGPYNKESNISKTFALVILHTWSFCQSIGLALYSIFISLYCGQTIGLTEKFLVCYTKSRTIPILLNPNSFFPI